MAMTVCSSSFAKPYPIRHKIESERNGILYKLSKMALLGYAKGKFDKVAQLDEAHKYSYFVGNEDATVSILLYEFGTGTGPAIRYFDERSAFTREISEGPAMEYLMHRYFDLYGQTDTVPKMRYQSSPIIRQPRTWSFAIRETAVLLKKRNMSQFMLGSFFCSITPSGPEQLRLHIWNVTSKRSYLLGMGKRVQRPFVFGNVTQHIYLDFSRAEAQTLANSYKKKSRSN